MHLDFLECVDLFVQLVPDLKYRAECSFAQEAHLVECFLLSARLDEWPNLLGLRHDIILRSFMLFVLRLRLLEFNDLNCLSRVT